MNPRMITVARESRGFSQSQLSRVTGIAQGTLSKVENGFAELPEDRVQAIADALDYPRALFDWNDPVYGFGSSMFHHRKQQSLSQGLLRKIEASISLLCGGLTRLSHGVEIDTPLALPAIDTTESSPEHIAQAVRAAWRVPMGPLHNLTGMLEAAGVLVIRRNFGTHRMPGISIRIPRGHTVIVLNTGMPADRERFTLAHELAHLVMHDLPHPEDDAEREADRFAAELLMPAAQIRPQLSRIDLGKAAALKQQWQVAMSSLIRRARDLDVITDARYRSLLTHMSQKGWLKNEPVLLPHEEQTVVPSVIRLHVHQHQYSHQQLADLAGLNRAEFVREFDPPYGPADQSQEPARRGGLRLVR